MSALTLEIEGKELSFREAGYYDFSLYSTLAPKGSLKAARALFKACLEEGDESLLDSPQVVLSLLKHVNDIIVKPKVEKTVKGGELTLVIGEYEMKFREPGFAELDDWLSDEGSSFERSLRMARKCYISGVEELFDRDEALGITEAMDEYLAGKTVSLKNV